MIYKRKGSDKWQVKFEYRGQLYQFSSGTRDKKMAQDIETTHRNELLLKEMGLWKEPARKAPTLEDFGAKFIAQIFVEVQNPGTRKYYTMAWERLEASSMGKLRLDEITKRVTDEYIQERLKAGDTVYQVNHALRTLRRALHLAESWGIIPRAPKIHTLQEESRKEVLTEEDIAALLTHCEPMMQAALIVLYDTGMRPGELCRLKWTDIFEGFLHVREGKTDAAERKIPLTVRVQEVLNRLHCASEFVFTRNAGRRPLTVFWLSHRFTDARRKSGSISEDKVLYATRHTYLTKLATTGIDLFTFKTIAGHTSTEVSKKYVHVPDERIRHAGKLLEGK